MFSSVKEKLIAKSTAPSVTAIVELDNYLAEPHIDLESGDPLKWWREHKDKFPNLYRIACKRYK